MMLGMDVQKHSLLSSGARIIAANHPSTSDPFFVAAMLQKKSYILINSQIFEMPVFGAILRHSGQIPVRPGSGQAAMDAALAYLMAGKTVVIFPEGDLSPEEGGFQKVHTGVARLALLSGAPVFPVGIHLVSKRLSMIPTRAGKETMHARWYLRGPYHMTIGRPLHFSGNIEDRQHVRNVADIIMHQIIELAHESKTRMQSIPALSF
jgi:1-acyl-sn-glycerol-3-phosphate acyltransferase